MELDVNALDMLPAPEESRLMACTVTCGRSCYGATGTCGITQI
ncbi:ALQxL family class IV lanthipeptide [Microbispora amethystogenes]|nr:ALQxL family class IV lanthipeptide [Microbispora cellulosiformans]